VEIQTNPVGNPEHTTVMKISSGGSGLPFHRERSPRSLIEA